VRLREKNSDSGGRCLGEGEEEGDEQEGGESAGREVGASCVREDWSGRR